MSTSTPSITLRLMTERDLAMLHDWLNRSHIVEWWGGEEVRPTLDEVLEHYQPEAMKKESVTPYVAMLGDEPIGYAQSYVVLESGDGWWEDETDPGVRGIDQSLANPTQLNKGLGTKLVSALVELLFSDPAVTRFRPTRLRTTIERYAVMRRLGSCKRRSSLRLTGRRFTCFKHDKPSRAGVVLPNSGVSPS